MNYLYLITAMFLTYLFCIVNAKTTIYKILGKLPLLILAIVYSILSAKAFGVI